MKSRINRFAALGAVMLLCAAPARAGDGQIDLVIDPATGVTIDKNGSYVLVANVTMTDENADAITISGDAEDVTIDLHGHTITGKAGGTGIGIDGADREKVKIVNGTIRDFSSHGIRFTGDDGRYHFEDLTLECNGGSGILIDITISDRSGAVVIRVHADGNVGEGIDAGDDAVISHCVATDNGGTGIKVRDRAVITDSTASDNGLNGIEGDDSVEVRRSSVEGNTNDGILLEDKGVVIGCVATGNGAIGIHVSDACLVAECTSQSTDASGSHAIQVDGRCRVENNQVVTIGDQDPTAPRGIRVAGSLNRIDGNNVTAATGSIGIEIVGVGNFVVRNSVTGGSATKYVIAASNTAAARITPGTAFAAADPWANFIY